MILRIHGHRTLIPTDTFGIAPPRERNLRGSENDSGPFRRNFTGVCKGLLRFVLPVQRFHELAEAGEVGSLASQHYSFMGYQANDDEWRNRYGSEVAQRMIEAEVDAALITPA